MDEPQLVRLRETPASEAGETTLPVQTADPAFFVRVYLVTPVPLHFYQRSSDSDDCDWYIRELCECAIAQVAVGI